jgi:environmental stress-induced protein Ves
MRVPAQGSDFRWRVSVAHIGVSGPFSDFAGYNRKMVLLRGAGVRLTFGGGRQTVLRDIGELVEFSGALAADCQLLNGPCTDLNLIVSESMTSARAWVERLTEPRALETESDLLLVFPISETLSLEYENGTSTTLEPWDLALISPGDGVLIGPPTTDVPPQHGATVQCDRSDYRDSDVAPLVFFATLQDEGVR